MICTPQNSSLHAASLHQGCRRMRTVPAPGLVPPSQAPRTSVWAQPLPARGGPAARQLSAPHWAVYVVRQSQRRETHQSSPGRKKQAHCDREASSAASEMCDRVGGGEEERGGNVCKAGRYWFKKKIFKKVLIWESGKMFGSTSLVNCCELDANTLTQSVT